MGGYLPGGDAGYLGVEITRVARSGVECLAAEWAARVAVARYGVLTRVVLLCSAPIWTDAEWCGDVSCYVVALRGEMS